MKLPKIMEGDYEPHFSVKHMLKDVRIAGRMAEAAGIELTIAEAARTALLDEVKHGHADEDYSAVGRKYFPVTPKTQAAPSPAPVASAVEAAILPISEERETVGDAMSRNGDNGMEVVEEVTPLNEADAPWKPVEVSVPAVVDELETEQPESAATSAEADSEEGEPRRGFFSRMLGRVADY
jgi:hypothetical protein